MDLGKESETDSSPETVHSGGRQANKHLKDNKISVWRLAVERQANV
jgi:hypothetical protein